MSKATLFSLPGSHPAVSVKLMLDYKGIEYKTVDLMPLMHKAVVRAAGFPGTTVPALKFNGEKLQGSVDIARALDRIVPEPPLLPADEEARKQVLMAEAFGEAELQHAVRQILWNAVRRQPKSIATFLEGSNLPLPPKIAAYTSGPIIWGEYKVNDSTDENVQANLAALPGWLDRLLPNLDLEGEGALPAPEYEPGRGPAPTTAAEVAGDDEPDPDLVGVG